MEEGAKVQYKFIYWLRFVGVSLILYDHLGALRNPDWFVARGMEHFVNQPLGIIQYFGALGVSLFFIISGFCFVPKDSGGGHFFLRRIIKIEGALISTTILFFIFNAIISACVSPTYWDQYSIIDWFEGGTLICFILGKESVINGAVWYLFPLIAFEVLIAIFYLVIKKNQLYLIAGIDSIYVLLLLWVKITGNYIVQMQWLVFVLFPLFGILLRGLLEKRLSFTKFLGIILVHWLICVECIAAFRAEYYSAQPYLISLVYAVLIFGICMICEQYFVLPPMVKFIADISFSIYLLHMTFGGMMMSYMEKLGVFSIGFVLTICIVVILAIIHYKWIEKGVLDRLCKSINKSKHD